jgi:hypothetical protein
MSEEVLSIFIVDDSIALREELKSIIFKLQSVNVVEEAGDTAVETPCNYP